MAARLFRLRRFLLLGLVLSVLVGGSASQASPARAAGLCFKETGFCIEGRFVDYWSYNGGLARNGYPLSGERREVLEDGKEYLVQYFERVRLEYHPENRAPDDIQLGQFGRQVLSEAYADIHDYREYQRVTAPVAPLAGAVFFPQTGHNLGGRFLKYWQENGGLAQFGYPLTEERWDTLPNPQGLACCATQYFERARFEYHPENEGTPYVVLLGQFGRRIMGQNSYMSGDFGHLYRTDTQLRERLGAPLLPQVETQGATQVFQRGQMFWRADKRWIYVLLGEPDHGTVAQEFYQNIYFVDSWAEGQPIGGGPAPTEPGAFLPQRGFYKVWREHEEIRSAIGYATKPREYGHAMTVQQFAAGLLITSDTDEGRFVYAIYIQRESNSSRLITYERLGN